MDVVDEMCHLEVKDNVTANYDDDDVGAKEGQEDDDLGDVGGN